MRRVCDKQRSECGERYHRHSCAAFGKLPEDIPRKVDGGGCGAEARYAHDRENNHHDGKAE